MVEPQNQQNKPQYSPQSNQTLLQNQGTEGEKSASFFFRFGAYTIDTIIITLVTAFLPLGQQQNESFNFIASIFSLQTIIYLAIFIIYSSLATYKYQATLGKKLFGLKVVSGNNSSLRFDQVLLRETVKELTGAVTFGAIFLVALINIKRQAVHDKLAKTFVLKH